MNLFIYYVEITTTSTILKDLTQDYITLNFIHYFIYLFKNNMNNLKTKSIETNLLNKNLMTFYNNILDRTLNYFLIIYNKNNLVYLNDPCLYYISKEFTSIEYHDDISCLNINYLTKKFLRMLINKEYSLSLYDILLECTNGKYFDFDDKTIKFNGEFSFEDKEYFEVYIRNRDNINDQYCPFEIELYKISSFKKAEYKIKQGIIEKQKLLARIVHEFKTPIIGISSLAKQAKDLIPDNLHTNYYSTIDQIENISNYILLLISDLIKIGKQKADLTVEIQVVDLHNICNFCIGIANTLLFINNRSNHVNVKLDYDEDLTNLIIYSDEIRLKQLLLNFLSNSVKFTKKGEILLSCKYKNSSSSFIEIVIKDSGIGIDQSQLKSINLKNYEDIKIDRKLNEYGSGLGINITHEISRLLNIDLDIDSIIDIGTTVILKIVESDMNKSTFHLKNSFSPSAVNCPVTRKSSSRKTVLADFDNLVDKQSFFNPGLLISEDEFTLKYKIVLIDDSLLMKNNINNCLDIILK